VKEKFWVLVILYTHARDFKTIWRSLGRFGFKCSNKGMAKFQHHKLGNGGNTAVKNWMCE